MDFVLQAAMLQSAPSEVLWTDTLHKAFQDALAQAFGLPDYHQPFHLHVHVREGFVTGILIQEHESHCHPVVCYSSRLTPVVLCMLGCLRAVAAVAIMIDKFTAIELAHECVVHVPDAELLILKMNMIALFLFMCAVV